MYKVMRMETVWLRIPIFTLMCFLLASCGSSTAQIPSTPLSQHHWCGYPAMSFTDAATSPPITLPDWAHARSSLRFAPLLPTTAPRDLCLVSVGTTAHDPAAGDMFSITYAGPDNAVLTLAETSQHSANTAVQCGTSVANSITIATCQQLVAGIMVTMTGTYSIQYFHTLLAHLHTDVHWMPNS